MKTKNFLWKITILAAILALTIALLAGCGRSDSGDAAIMPPEDEGQEYNNDLDENTGETEQDTEDTEQNLNVDDIPPPHETDPAFTTIVATVNGIEITAGEVLQEMEWIEHMLVHEYIALFPEDTAFNYERVFRGSMTFGEVVLEESLRYAALSKLFEEYADQRGIAGDEFTHVVMAVIFEIIEDPEQFAPFAQYMSEETEATPIEERALALVERAHAGEDFKTLVETYGEDPGMIQNPEGYTFVSGVMVQPFEQATRELEIGEISGIVWSDFGIHIIKRVEPNPDNVMRPQFHVPGSEDEEEELLGAMHILLMSAPEITHEEKMMEAIFTGFETKFENADLVILPAFDEIPVGEN